MGGSSSGGGNFGVDIEQASIETALRLLGGDEFRGDRVRVAARSGNAMEIDGKNAQRTYLFAPDSLSDATTASELRIKTDLQLRYYGASQHDAIGSIHCIVLNTLSFDRSGVDDKGYAVLL